MELMHGRLVERQWVSNGPPLTPEYLAWDIGPRLMAVNCTLFSIAIFTMLLRVYVRVSVLHFFGIDDWLMLIATILSTTCFYLFTYSIHLGLGKHAFNPSVLANFAPIFRYLYFYALFIIFAYSFIKLSIGFFLLRIADRTKWRHILHFTIGFLILFTVGSTLAIIFQCLPVKAGWDMTLRPPTGTAKCYPLDTFKNIGVFNSSVNIATDLLFALLPIPIVWKLQVNIRTKVGLGFIMALGLFASATAIYKTPMQYNFFKEEDWSGNGSWYYIWQQVELNTGITAANLPTLKPLFARFFNEIRNLTSGHSRSNMNSSAPYRSSGYIKQSETSAGSEFALKSLEAGRESRSGARASYADSEDRMLAEERLGRIIRDRPTKGIMKTTVVDVR